MGDGSALLTRPRVERSLAPSSGKIRMPRPARPAPSGNCSPQIDDELRLVESQPGSTNLACPAPALMYAAALGAVGRYAGQTEQHTHCLGRATSCSGTLLPGRSRQSHERLAVWSVDL